MAATAFRRLEDADEEQAIRENARRGTHRQQRLEPDPWARACCLRTVDRASTAEWMLLDNNAGAQPSLLQRLLCQCGPEARIDSGIKDIPEIAALAGVTAQIGTHSTAGSLQTLKFCE